MSAPVRENPSITPEQRWQQIKEEMKARARFFTFEGAVESLEALCARYAPEPGDAPERGSDGWYANEILWAVHIARSHLERGNASHAAAQTLVAGYLAGRWPAAQQWREQQEARRRGGRAAKYLPGVRALVDQLVAEHPNASARELWGLIPESKDGEGDGDPIGGFIVYRDGSRVVQVEDAIGREKSISFRSFSRYFTSARRK